MKKSKKSNLVKELEDLTFGIEIELKYVKRKEMAYFLKDKVFKTKEDLNNDVSYDIFKVKDKDNRIWKCVKDESLNDGRGGCEIVSPILTYSDIPLVIKILDSIRDNFTGERSDYYIIADEECSVHIHVGAMDITPFEVANLYKMWSIYEDLIFQALEVLDNRESEYCRRIDEAFLRRLRQYKDLNYYELRSLWYYDTLDEEESDWYDEEEPSWEMKYDSSRYRALNLHSLFNKDTIEFRLFNGTTNSMLVKSYIQFTLAFFNYAVRQKKSYNYKKSLGYYNLKTKMKNLLNKLDLKGTEFKDCRRIFQNSLSNDDDEY